jgi:hypothetical protein
MTQVVEYLLCENEALSSNLRTAQTNPPPKKKEEKEKENKTKQKNPKPSRASKD